ncbi:AAA family ATPase [Nakamurella sp.]|uniref:AAA family ATPase n=1 Tax=Nakamurella sp. TaxID=1869182 RepID=UPI003B3B286B
MVRRAVARPIRTIRGEPVAAGGYPWDVPAVRQILADGLEPGAVTILVGENGSGKSTLVEAIAVAYGLSPEGGSTGARHSTRATESPLSERVSLVRNPGAARWGFFLRAETMHGFFSYLEANPGGPDPAFHEMSHGESFVATLSARFTDPGLYVMDEPEAALSFTTTLALAHLLAEMARGENRQAVVATHSPILAALPGADLYELGPWGIRRTRWSDLALVAQWRRFLADPDRFLADPDRDGSS